MTHMYTISTETNGSHVSVRSHFYKSCNCMFSSSTHNDQHSTPCLMRIRRYASHKHNENIHNNITLHMKYIQFENQTQTHIHTQRNRQIEGTKAK